MLLSLPLGPGNAKERSMKLSVVVPFYNELRTLPTVIDRLLAVDFGALGLETELVFVDDGSTDASRSLLDPAPRDDVRLLVHPRNLGKGAAVKTGLEAATGDVLCIQDADLEYDPADLPALLRPILDGDYQVVYGNRFKGSAAGLYYSHRVANRLLNLMVNLAFNRYLSDVYTGYKVFTRQAFSGLRLSAKTFTVEMELTAHFLRKGLVVFEVPISYRARTYAEGKKIHFRDGFLAAGAVLRYRFQPAPPRSGPVARGAPDRRRRHHPRPGAGGPGGRTAVPALHLRPARALPGRDGARGGGRPWRLLGPAPGPGAPGAKRAGPHLPARPRGALRQAAGGRDRRGPPDQAQGRAAGGHRGGAERHRPAHRRRHGPALDGQGGGARRGGAAAGAGLPAARRRVRRGSRARAPLHAGGAQRGGHGRRPGARGDPPGQPARRDRLVGRGPDGKAGAADADAGGSVRQAGGACGAGDRAARPAVVRAVGAVRCAGAALPGAVRPTHRQTRTHGP